MNKQHDDYKVIPYPKHDAYLNGSWVFVLEELGEQTTRVIERMRADYQPRLWLAPLVYLLLEPATFVMERKMLLGIKQRAERGRSKASGIIRHFVMHFKYPLYNG